MEILYRQGFEELEQLRQLYNATECDLCVIGCLIDSMVLLGDKVALICEETSLNTWSSAYTITIETYDNLYENDAYKRIENAYLEQEGENIMTKFEIREYSTEIAACDIDHIHNVPQLENGISLDQLDCNYTLLTTRPSLEEAQNELKNMESYYGYYSGSPFAYYRVTEYVIVECNGNQDESDYEEFIHDIAPGVEPRYRPSEMERGFVENMITWFPSKLECDGEDNQGMYWLNPDDYAKWEDINDEIEDGQYMTEFEVREQLIELGL